MMILIATRFAGPEKTNAMMSQAATAHTFTVDVEDYFHVSGFANRIAPATWHTYESRVGASTQRVLRLLAKHQVQGTFFILGWVAERYPELVRDIHQDGHELGTHGYWHQLVYDQTESEFREDLRRSLDVIDAASGVRPRAYRAPSFSITRRSEWALGVLFEEGIEIDSSIFPIRHDRYGVPDLHPAPHEEPLGQKGLWEVPPSVVDVGPLRFPIAGGGYFRIFPERFMRQLQSRFLAEGQRPYVFYIHPWEVDPEQPRLPASALSSFRHYRNLHHTEARLDRMLARIRFGTISQLVAAQSQSQLADVPSLSAGPPEKTHSATENTYQVSR